jgi:hypothetical protein
VSSGQHPAPGAVLGKLGPGLDLIDGLPVGYVARFDVGGAREPSEFPVLGPVLQKPFSAVIY